MPNPNPEQFAKVVLWHLASLRAEVANAQAQLDGLQDAMGRTPSEAMTKENAARTTETLRELYEDACRQAGLSIEPPGVEPGNS